MILNTKLLDKFNVINPIADNMILYLKNNIDNIFENLIIHDNQIFNTYLFNHITYSNNTNELQVNTINIVIKHFISYLKKQQMFFRESNKKNKFSLGSVNTFIDTFYKKLMKVNKMLIHFPLNNVDTNDMMKWGSSEIIIKTLKNFHNIILNDMIIRSAIKKSIDENANNERNNDMYVFIKYVNKIEPYCPNNNIITTINSIVDNSFLELYQPLELLEVMNDNIKDVYEFKHLYQYFINNTEKYYYIGNNPKINRFSLLKDKLFKLFSHIINSNEITFIQQFIIQYKTNIISLQYYIDLPYLLCSKSIITLEDLISYYGTLYEIFNNNIELYKIIEITLNNHLNKIQSSEYINELVEYINSNILECNNTSFLYSIASKIVNKDEVIKKLCNKFIYRIVYTDTKYQYEISNFENISHYFNKKELYQYNVIYNDYIKSNNRTIHLIENIVNKKLIITSLNSWHINHMVGSMNYMKSKENGMFSSMLISIMKKYNIAELERKQLIFYPHLGSLNITLQLNNKCNITLTPAQMLCLELFIINIKTKSHYHYSYIFDTLKTNLVNYSDNFINNIIRSLVNGSIIEKNSINLTESWFVLNTYLNESVDLIKIFHDINNTAHEIMENTMIELAHERNDILMCNINHIVKTQTYDIDTLYGMCKDSIQLFDVTRELYDKAIHTMVEKKYIANDLKKIVWI